MLNISQRLEIRTPFTSSRTSVGLDTSKEIHQENITRVNLEALYLRFPASLQNVLCSFEGWKIQNTRFSGRFPELLREARERTYWSRERICEYRDAQIKKFVRHCVESVPYYRNQFKWLDIKADEFRTLEDLKTLPILQKSEVQQQPHLFRPDRFPQRTITAHTSGTTGGGLQFNTTLEAVQRQWAIWWRYREWH